MDKGAGVAIAAAVAFAFSLGPSDARAQAGLAAQPRDADAGSSYLLRKSTLWYNRFFPSLFTHGAAYADLDKDGRIDVVLASGNGQDVRTPIKIMMNTGSGFADQTGTQLSNAQPGLIHARKALAGDYNGDGWPDVFIVGHGYDQPPFPANTRSCSCPTATARCATTRPCRRTSVSTMPGLGDIDGNGSVDIMVVQQGTPFFLVNDGAGHFTRDSARMPADVLYKNFYTGEMIDVDLDGHLDLLLGGHEYEAAYNTIYWGDPSGAYERVAKDRAADRARQGHRDGFRGRGPRWRRPARPGDRSHRRLAVLQRTRAADPAPDRAAAVRRRKRRPHHHGYQPGLDGLHPRAGRQWRPGSRHLPGQRQRPVQRPVRMDQRRRRRVQYTGAVKPAPTLSIADAGTTEGQAGTKVLNFQVQSSQPVIYPVTFDAFTDDGLAVEGEDYVAAEQQVTNFRTGSSTASVSVAIKGDGVVEGHEAFTVNLANVSGAMLRDGQALGRILNDDLSGLAIGDASVVEGAAGQTTARFEITLSHPMPTPATFNIATSNGSATAGSDYVARSVVGRVLDAGRTRQAFEVQVNGDALAEPDETFHVTLSDVVGATLADGAAIGTISNDDAPAIAAPTVEAAARGERAPVLVVSGQPGDRRPRPACNWPATSTAPNSAWPSASWASGAASP